VVLTVRYGAKPIEFEKGKAAIAVGKKDRLVQTIETVVAAVEAGELDAVLAQMSKSAVMTKSMFSKTNANLARLQTFENRYQAWRSR
jgi:hypothetical protein